jgi:radical SAM protein with 4Fe4S-binding SPASM domain
LAIWRESAADPGVRPRVKPFWWPPGLLARQAASALYLGFLAKWSRLPQWMLGCGLRCLQGAAGSTGMGCIGFPSHAVWEVTARCNLKCIHCHSSRSRKDGELSTDEGKDLLRQLAEVDEFRMVAFTGGEPLMRRDIFDLLDYSRELGFSNTLATNGTLVDEGTARDLRRSGVSIAAVSLDGDRETHDAIRGHPGAYEAALGAMKAISGAGITLHVNITLMGSNLEQVEELMSTCRRMGAGIVLLYQLVPVGNGAKIGNLSLDATQHERLIRFMSTAQRDSYAVMEPVAGPQYWSYLLESRGIREGPLFGLAEKVFHGCSAGRGFAYVKANGDVLPCPFIEMVCGNVLTQGFKAIWEGSPVFRELRNREELLKGRCGGCRYRSVCGGCRGRAYKTSGDLMAEDPLCFLPREVSASD